MGHKLKVILTVILIASMSIFLSFGLQSDDAEAAAGSSLGRKGRVHYPRRIIRMAMACMS